MREQHSIWRGVTPPQYIYANRRFAGIALAYQLRLLFGNQVSGSDIAVT